MRQKDGSNMRTVKEIKASIEKSMNHINKLKKENHENDFSLEVAKQVLEMEKKEFKLAVTTGIPLNRLEEICNAEREGRLPVNFSSVWSQQDIDGSWYSCSNCGAEWVLEADDPFENNMKFCPECGAYIKSITFREYDEVLEDIVDRVITREAAEQEKERELNV